MAHLQESCPSDTSDTAESLPSESPDEGGNPESYTAGLPPQGDPIYKIGPDNPVSTRENLQLIASLIPNAPEDRKLFLNNKSIPRTLVPLDRDDLWESWRSFARAPEKVEDLWRHFFGDELPPMTAYELWAIIRNVNSRLMFRKTDECLPPCVTDCYDPTRGRFWRRSRFGQWNSYTEKQYFRRLFRIGRRATPGPGGAPSEIQSDIEADTENQAIITEGISGLTSGIHRMQDRLFLARYGFEMIEPDDSIKPTRILDWLSELLGDESRERLLDWIYYGVSRLQKGERGQSRALVLAGPPECGKSFLIRGPIRRLLGGRAADAAPWLLGTTEFASELGAAELLYADDALGDGQLRTRLRTAARLKELLTVGSKFQPMHAKGKDRYYHTVWWRIAVALNDAPEALAMLPPLDEGLSDKVILLRARETILSKRGDHAASIIQSMEEELPGLMAFILKRGMQGPVDGRGPLPWQDPVLAGKLRETAPEYALAGMILEMIEKRDWGKIAMPIIEPTLTELCSRLRDCCGERYTRLCPTDQRTRNYLSRLERDGAVSSRRINGKTRWCLEHLDKWMQEQYCDDPG